MTCSSYKYGEITGNRRINRRIYECFDIIHKDDVRRFVREFRQQPHDELQALHTLRELVVGAYLTSRGFRPRYEKKICEKTPDWCLLDDSGQINGIVELVNYHPAKKHRE